MSYKGINENFSIEHLLRYIVVDLVYSQRIPERESVNVSKYKRISKDTTFISMEFDRTGPLILWYRRKVSAVGSL